MNIVMTGTGKLVEIQGTAEGKTFTRKDLDKLLNMAQSGIKSVIKLEKKLIGKLR